MLGLSDTGKAGIEEGIAQIPGIEKFTDDERAALAVSVTKIASDSITQAVAGLLKVEQPVVEQFAAFNKNLADAIKLLQSLKDDGIPISGMLLGGKRAALPADIAAPAASDGRAQDVAKQ